MIAIQPDRISVSDGRIQSYSDTWIAWLKQENIPYKLVDVYSNTIIHDLKECNGFMWRFSISTREREIYQRLIPVILNMGIKVFPDHDTIWHYDDKIAQQYLFDSLEIPTPTTWVFWRKDIALKFLEKCEYPIVLKLAGGASSKNVRLLNSYDEAFSWVELIFSSGLFELEKPLDWKKERLINRLSKAKRSFFSDENINPGNYWLLHKNYLLLQQFVKGNDFDIRITVIGNRVFGYRRFNKKNDFRASGSGSFNVDPSQIPKGAIQLGYQTAQKLKMQSAAIDILVSEGKYVINEVSYTFVSWMVEDCPGYWVYNETIEEFNWIEENGIPARFIVEDFLNLINN